MALSRKSSVEEFTQPGMVLALFQKGYLSSFYWKKKKECIVLQKKGLGLK